MVWYEHIMADALAMFYDSIAIYFIILKTIFKTQKSIGTPT